MKQRSRFTLRARLRSVRFAARGVRTLLATEPNAQLHAVATIAVIMAGFGCHLGRWEWCAITLAISSVWCAEALNTALEALSDAASPEFHPLVAKAKDVAAGGVLLSALGSVAVGAVVFGPRLASMM